MSFASSCLGVKRFEPVAWQLWQSRRGGVYLSLWSVLGNDCEIESAGRDSRKLFLPMNNFFFFIFPCKPVLIYVGPVSTSPAQNGRAHIRDIVWTMGGSGALYPFLSLLMEWTKTIILWAVEPNQWADAIKKGEGTCRVHDNICWFVTACNIFCITWTHSDLIH